MGFKVSSAPYLVWQSVPITRLDPDGTPRTHNVRFQFEIVDDAEMSSAIERGDVLLDGGNSEESRKAADFICRITKDWDGVVDDDGNKLPFDEQIHRQLLYFPYYSEPVIRGYIAARRGRKAGN